MSADSSLDASRAFGTSRDGGGPFTLTEEDKTALRAYGPAMAAGRRATRAKKYDEAIGAFTTAVEKRPTDARARSERGYARLLGGDIAGAQVDLDAAKSLGAKPEVLAQIWFNLGLVHEKKRDAEAARSAFAISGSLAPSAAVEAKLAGKSRCTAEKVLFAKGADLPLVKSWVEAYKETFQEGAASTEKEAKEAVCTAVDWDAPNGPLGNNKPADCSGGGPWIVTRNYMQYSQDQGIIFPIDAKKMVLVTGDRVGGWMAHCSGSHDVKGDFIVDLLHVRRTFDGSQSVLVAEMGDDDGGEGSSPWTGSGVACKDSDGTIEDSFFDRAGHHLLRLVRLTNERGDPEVKLRFVGATVVLDGGGCNDAIDLPSLAVQRSTKQ